MQNKLLTQLIFYHLAAVEYQALLGLKKGSIKPCSTKYRKYAGVYCAWASEREKGPREKTLTNQLAGEATFNMDSQARLSVSLPHPSIARVLGTQLI